MCSPARCSTCGKTTWRGCGQHVEAVMSRVPATQQCRCEPTPSKSMFSLFRRR